MIKEITASGKDINEAKENARAALGVGPLDEVNFTIVDLGSKGIFGLIGKRNAQVKASIEIPDAPERRERPKKEPRPAEKPHEAREEDRTGNNSGSRKPKGEQNRKPREQKPKAEKIPQFTEPKNEKPKAAVIPEKDLTFERKEVVAGQDVAFDLINAILSDTGLNASAELYSCSDGTRRIAIIGEDASVLIGHHGETLDALQYLANLASAQKNEAGERDKTRVTVDVEGYRAKREETLRALARKMAAKALRNHRSVMLEPMSAYERRIIHSEVQGIEGVSTNSIGSDSNRKIVIYLTDKKPAGIFEDEDAEETTVTETVAEAAADAAEDVAKDEE